MAQYKFGYERWQLTDCRTTLYSSAIWSLYIKTQALVKNRKGNNFRPPNAAPVIIGFNYDSHRPNALHRPTNSHSTCILKLQCIAVATFSIFHQVHSTVAENKYTVNLFVAAWCKSSSVQQFVHVFDHRHGGFSSLADLSLFAQISEHGQTFALKKRIQFSVMYPSDVIGL